MELSAAVDAARAAVGQARAERGRAAETLARAKTTLANQTTLAKAGAIARDDVDAAETSVRAADEALKAAEFTVKRSESELESAQARLEGPTTGGRTVTVVAPVDGVILKRVRESETLVPAGDPLVEIGDPRRIEIVADFLSTDAVRIPPGAPVIIEQWGGRDALHGKVRRIEPAGFMKVSALGVEEQRVNIIIDFVDPPADARLLGDAFRVEVRAVIWQEENVLKVPVGALFRRGEGWAVFRIEQGRALVTDVQLGQRNETDGQILQGLSEGQTVVLHPPDTLMDRMRVAPRSK